MESMIGLIVAEAGTPVCDRDAPKSAILSAALAMRFDRAA
jgi:hypothetical protein